MTQEAASKRETRTTSRADQASGQPAGPTPERVPSRATLAATALILGGCVAALAYIPFTIAHGPTSFNLNREILGWRMESWGALMGTVPQLLIGAGLWHLRDNVAGGRRTARWALVLMAAVMYATAAMNLATLNIGPPLDMYVLAPASVVVAVTSARRGAVRVVLVALAVTYVAPEFQPLAPEAVTASVGGDFRLFGLVAYALVGLLWATLGIALLRGAGLPGRS